MLKILVWTALVLLGIAVLALVWLWPRYPYAVSQPPGFRVVRLLDEPILTPQSGERLAQRVRDEGYANINGPSLIRVPEWVEDPLGVYYLYFAHHKGDYIRMAYADTVAGPWTVYEPGVLALADSLFPEELNPAGERPDVLSSLWAKYPLAIFRDMLILGYRAGVTDQATRRERGLKSAANNQPHIASPDVIVDEANQRLLMYYHGLSENGVEQFGRVATSSDGISFTPRDTAIASSYLRAFRYRGLWYALGMPGVLYRSSDGLSDLEMRRRLLFDPDMRHSAVLVDGQSLHVFWSRVGDVPESILYSRVDLSSENWNDWRATRGIPVLQPERQWEGADLPRVSSLRGELESPARELRDPAVFTDVDGATYLLYTGAGEQAIGIARIEGL